MNLRAVAVVVALAASACGSEESVAIGSDSDSAIATGVVTVYEDLSNGHIDPPFSSETSPPVGGDHYPFWHNCGFYRTALIDGAATHTLEHGVVWITYNPASATDSELADLQGMAAANDRLLISPYEHAEKFVVSAWGAQLRGPTSVDSVEVEQFIADYTDGSAAPEPGARCSGGAGIPPGDARTLADGALVPDEWS